MGAFPPVAVSPRRPRAEGQENLARSVRAGEGGQRAERVCRTLQSIFVSLSSHSRCVCVCWLCVSSFKACAVLLPAETAVAAATPRAPAACQRCLGRLTDEECADVVQLVRDLRTLPQLTQYAETGKRARWQGQTAWLDARALIAKRSSAGGCGCECGAAVLCARYFE